MTTTIKQEDLVQSIADALQYISYYHPKDYIQALGRAYEREESPAAKDAMAQILINSRLSFEGHRPICQDTGIAIAFIKVGMEVRWDTKMSLADLVNEGVRRAYTDKDNPLRASMLADPDGKRKSTGDNTPAVTHVELVPGDKVEVIVAAKGDALVSGIAPGEHAAVEQQLFAWLPARDLGRCQRVEVHAPRAGGWRPVDLRPVGELRLLELRRPRTVEREMHVPRGRAVRDHRDGFRRGVRGVFEDLHVEHGR